MMEYYLAIDLGASGGRHILAHMEEGRMITEEIYRFSNAPVKDEEHLYWDTERLFSEILKGLKRAGELGKIPRSVSIDTWGVDYVLLDKKGALVHRPYCYRDRRTEQWKERVKELIPPRKLFERTGAQYTEYITVFQLYADKQAGLMDSAAHFFDASRLLSIPAYGREKMGIYERDHDGALERQDQGVGSPHCILARFKKGTLRGNFSPGGDGR